VSHEWLPLEDAMGRYKPELVGVLDLAGANPTPHALIIHGDVKRVERGVLKTVDILPDLSAKFEQQPPAAIFIRGDLIAPDAIIEEYDFDWSPSVFVTGSVITRAMMLYGSEFMIDGDLTVTETIFGFYNHGRISVRGTTRANLILDSDYTFELTGPVQAPYRLGSFYRGTVEPSAPSSELTHYLVWDAVTDRNNLAFDYVFNAISHGEPLLLPESLRGVKPHEQVGQAPLKVIMAALARQEAGREVTELDLKSMDLRSVPEALRPLTKLRTLSLADNQISSLPDWMASFNALEVLNLSGTALKAWPEALASLPCLRELRLEGAHIATLRESPSGFVALELLTYGDRLGLTEDAGDVQVASLCVDLSHFPKLRQAEAQLSNIRLEVDEDVDLWAAPWLEALTLDFQYPAVWPEGLRKAQGLRLLSISLASEGVELAIEILRALPSLEILDLNIFSTITRNDHRRIVEALPRLYVRRAMTELIVHATEPGQCAHFEPDPAYSDRYVDGSKAAELEQSMAAMGFDGLRLHLLPMLDGISLGVSAVNRSTVLNEGAEKAAAILALGHLDAACSARDRQTRCEILARAQEDLHSLLPRRGPFTTCAWRLMRPHFLVACAAARLIDAMVDDGGDPGSRTRATRNDILAETSSEDALSAPDWLREPLVKIVRSRF
jgi:hypothetical protein